MLTKSRMYMNVLVKINQDLTKYLSVSRDGKKSNLSNKILNHLTFTFEMI